jgi:Flp pilus assembly protein TadD
MSRDNAVFAACGLLLGLIVGSLVIGPKVAQSKLAGAPSTEAPVAPAASSPVSSMTPAMPAGGAAAAGGNPMAAVLAKIAANKQTLEKNPNDFGALSELGNMYMDAGKYPQAIDYYERALRVRDEPSLRTDLGICYKETGQLDKALAALQQVSRERPDEWQPLFNQAVVLVGMKRFDEARAIATKLRGMRPDDAAVAKLNEALAKPQS